jgi:hypothetical protein
MNEKLQKSTRPLLCLQNQMKKLIIFAFFVLMPLLAFAGERTYFGSHSVAESRKNKLLIDEFDTMDLVLKTPAGEVKIVEAWMEKATIAGGLFRAWKIVDGYRIVMRVEIDDDFRFKLPVFWPDAKVGFAMHADINPRFMRYQRLSRSKDLPSYPLTLYQCAPDDWYTISHTIVLKHKEPANREE